MRAAHRLTGAKGYFSLCGAERQSLQAPSPAAPLLCRVPSVCKRGALLAAGRIRKFAVVCNKQNPRRAFSLLQRCKYQAQSTRRGASTTSLKKERLVCEYLHYVVSAMPRATSAERAETNEKRVICRFKLMRVNSCVKIQNALTVHCSAFLAICHLYNVGDPHPEDVPRQYTKAYQQ